MRRICAWLNPLRWFKRRVVGIGLPISHADCKALVTILEEADSFRVMGGLSFNRYDPFWWWGQHFHGGTTYWIILDRNIVTRVFELAEKNNEPLHPQQRLAAAIMAFGSLTHAYYDPFVALMEAAAHP